MAAVPPPPHELHPISLDGTGIKLSRDVSARFTSGGGKVYSGSNQQVIGSHSTPSPAHTRPTSAAGNRDDYRDIESQAESAEASSPLPNLATQQTPKPTLRWQPSRQGNHLAPPLPEERTQSAATSPPTQPHNQTTSNNTGLSSTQSVRSNKSPNKSAKQKNKKKKTKKSKPPTLTDYEQYISSIFDPSERIFFLALDSELERITDFYEERLGEAQTRFELLVAQLRELAAHRRLYKESRVTAGAAERFNFGWTKQQMPLTPRQPPKALRQDGVAAAAGTEASGSALHKAQSADHSPRPAKTHADSEETANDDFHRDASDDGSDEDEGAKRRTRALEKMEALATADENYQGSAKRGDRELATAHANAAGLSYDPVRYKAARHKLKEAIAEFYRGLELLRTFKVLNKDGFGKILKKFDKTLETHTSYQYFQAKVQESALVKSQRVEALLRSTEDAFTGFFEHGDRKKALDRLRMQTGQLNTSASHHASTSVVGFFLGISLCAVVGGIVEAMKPETQAEIPSYQALLRVYGALFLPVLFALLFGLNLAAFAHSRINALFIFEWDPRHALDHHQYFEMPAFLMLLLSVMFWVSFVNPFPSAIAPTTWPLVWLVATLLFLLCPLPIFHPQSRSWFIKSILRVFGFGFLCRGSVEFRDFFLGDELNSIAWPISTLWVFGCEYQRDWQLPLCEPNSTYWTAVLSSIPALLRLGQCLRRFIDSKFYARIHLLNAAKYSTSVLFYFFYINWRVNGSQKDGTLALWVYFACMMSSFTMSWDILMDWSLFHPNARWPLLRNELVFESVWPVYYWAIFSNVILRCSWIIYLLPGPASTTLRSFLIALLEVLRRWQWNFFRVGNEHQGNVDQYRALRDTPLPYYIPKAATSSEEDLLADEIDGKGKGGKVAGRRGSSTGLANRLRLRSWKTKWDVGPDYPAVTLVDGAQLQSHPDAQQQQSHHAPSISAAQAQSISGAGQVPQPGWSVAGTSAPTAGATSGRPSTMQRSNTVLGRMQLFLVPDRGGLSSRGPRLDEQSAAKGAMGRDYAPRAQEADGLDDDDDEEEDDDNEDDSDDDDDDDEEEINRGQTSTRNTNASADRPSTPRRHHQRRRSSATAGRSSASPRIYGYGGASTSTPIAVGRGNTRPATGVSAGGARDRTASNPWLVDEDSEDGGGFLSSSQQPYRTDAELRDEAAARSLSRSWSRQ